MSTGISGVEQCELMIAFLYSVWADVPLTGFGTEIICALSSSHLPIIHLFFPNVFF